MWSVWLVVCDCSFHSVCHLMDEDKRLMEASWWERLTEGETGSCSDGGAVLSSLQFSHPVVSNSLWPHGLQHTRLLSPSPIPRACSNLCPSSRWCYPIISSSVVPFSSCLQSFPESEFFPVSQFFISGGQTIGVSASASVLPMNIQDWFPLGVTGLIDWLPLWLTGEKLKAE